MKPGEFRPCNIKLTLFFRFEIKKLPGNFHLSTHSVDVQPDEYDFGHIIHEVNNRKQIFYFIFYSLGKLWKQNKKDLGENDEEQL